MIGLLRAELRRFTARRLMRVLAIGTLALLLLVLVRVATLSSRATTGGASRVSVEEQQQVGERNRERCEAFKAQGRIPPDVDCARQAEQVPPSAFEEEVVDQRLPGATALRATTTAVAIVVALLAFVAAASFVGADWQSGTMQALLFWEPRRGRVLFAKAVAVVAGAVGFLLVLQVVAYAGVWLIAVTRGDSEGLTSGLHVSNLLTTLRGAVFVSVVALLGYAIAGLSRFTAAALGGAFVYFAILENLLLSLRPTWERWLISRNVSAILAKRIDVFPAHRPSAGEDFGFTPFDSPVYVLTGVRGAVTLGVYLAILLGAYYLVFTRRDVT